MYCSIFSKTSIYVPLFFACADAEDAAEDAAEVLFLFDKKILSPTPAILLVE